MGAKANYGVDAPAVVRNLTLVGSAGLAVWLSTLSAVWNGVVLLPFPGADIEFNCGGTGLTVAVICALMTVWMLYDSKIGKLHLREAMLDRITWTGGEAVLDVGCGRGLLLIGAAKRLKEGRATGIDLWQSEDLSGNSAEDTRRNAELEGVADRIDIKTGDMRTMPFQSDMFDVIVSRAAIHNLYKVEQRAAAIAEIVRVMKPGGTALIDDIRHIDAYAKAFQQLDCAVTRSGSRLMALVLTMMTFGSLNPGMVVATKQV